VFADASLNVQGSDGLHSTIQIRNGKGRMSSAGLSEYLLYDTGTGTITYVEPQQRRYTQVTERELAANIQTAQNIRRTVEPYMQDILAGLSDEQRRMIERRMGSMLGAPAAGNKPDAASIKTVDRGVYTIAGLRCHSRGILKNGRPAGEVCMATAPGGKLSKLDFATLEKMVEFSRNMASTAKGMLGDVAGQLEWLATDIDGVPVAVRDLEQGKRYQVTAVSNVTLADELFGGYRQFRKQEFATLLQ
jgi:hypothetical protein